jgi:hypothetical protein
MPQCSEPLQRRPPSLKGRIMKTPRLALLTAATAVFAALSAAPAFAGTAKFDPYTDGAKITKLDTYTDGAKAGKFDSFTDGARSGKFDPYSEGAKIGKFDVFTDGAAL